MAAQGPIYARLAKGLEGSLSASVFVAFLFASLVSGLVMVLSGNTRVLSVENVRLLPSWVLLGGVIGAVHVAISMHAIPILGITAFTVTVVLGSLLGASLYDSAGILGLEVRPLTATKAFGICLVLLGVLIVTKRGG